MASHIKFHCRHYIRRLLSARTLEPRAKQIIIVLLAGGPFTLAGPGSFVFLGMLDFVNRTTVVTQASVVRRS